MIDGHGGNIYTAARELGCPPEDIFDMSSNLNPLGPPPGLLPHLQASLQNITALPQVDALEMVRAFAAWHGIDPLSVMAGNGSTQLIYALPPAMGMRKALILGPTYADYADACRMHHVAYEYLIAPETDKFEMDLSRLQRCARPYDAVFICNPNNPTGALIPGAELKALCRSCPDTFFIIDESYLPFVNEPEEASMLREGLANVVVLNSMSKIFRIPGLRIGFLIAPAAIIERMSRYRLPWSVNSVAQAAVLYLSAHGRQIEAFSKQSREFINQQKRHLARSLQGSSRLKLYPGVTPFVLARISAPGGARAVCRHLLKQHILVRNASNFEGVDETFFRFSIKSPEINARFADSLLEFLFALDSKQHHLQQISA